MKKSLFCLLSGFIFLCGVAAAEPKAVDVTREASRKASVDESISYLKSQLKVMTVPAEKRAVYIFLASVQEQMSLYSDAHKNYAAAAGISAADVDGLPKRSNQQLVIDAVRCALCCGDYPTADSYLNSSVRNSKNEQIQAYVKLYSQWSSLCAADTIEALQEPVEILKAYLKVDSMKVVHPVILLTLWYVTGEGEYAKCITKQYPKSTEAAIVKGDVQLLPTPFWFFVPKSGVAEIGTGTYSSSEEQKVVKEDTNEKGTGQISQKFTKWQLGLFKTEGNAKLLCEEVKKKGFDAYVTNEKRSSGTIYYIVLVNETKDENVAERLRSAGYDCYPVE